MGASQINRGISIASIVFISQDSFGYIPGSISGKYQSDYVDSSIWDSWWLATTMTDNWGETVVRQSFAPSAMVDPSGTLFTLNFHNSSGSSGIYYYYEGNQYSYNRMRPRRCVDSHDYNIEMGN